MSPREFNVSEDLTQKTFSQTFGNLDHPQFITLIYIKIQECSQLSTIILSAGTVVRQL